MFWANNAPPRAARVIIQRIDFFMGDLFRGYCYIFGEIEPVRVDKSRETPVTMVAKHGVQPLNLVGKSGTEGT